VDDVLDFEQSSETLGKPALSDIRQGLATAPVLLAMEVRKRRESRAAHRHNHAGLMWRLASTSPLRPFVDQSYPELGELIRRKFRGPGDVERVSQPRGAPAS
jgi:hypothetical protein